MNLPMMMLPLALFLSAPIAEAQDRCPITPGSTVQFTSGSSLYQSLEAAAPEQGEFETTAAYQARVSVAQQKLELNKTVVLEGIYDPDQVTYDADAQTFTISAYAWDNKGLGLKYVFRSGNPYGIEMKYAFKSHAMALDSKEETLGTYEASNAYGAATIVERIHRTDFGVFDRPAIEYRNSRYQPDWETTHKTGELQAPAIVLNVPINEAPDIKRTMRVGVLVQPKPPYVATGTYSSEPTITNPRDEIVDTNLIVGDMLCAVLSDSEGRVLKTIETAY